MVSTSTDGGLTWTSCKYTTLKEPICQGSILFYGLGDDGKGIILFSNPDSQTNRNNNTLKMSEDDGVTWNIPIQEVIMEDTRTLPVILTVQLEYYMNMVSRISEALLFRMLSCHSYNKTCVELKNRLI